MSVKQDFLEDFKALLAQYDATVWSTIDGEIRVTIPKTLVQNPEYEILILPSSCNFDNI